MTVERLRTKPELHLVLPQPTVEAELAALVPDLIAAERQVATLRNRLAVHRIALAKQRGVTFIREEHVRQEFGK